MITDRSTACRDTGFVEAHAQACEDVAARTHSLILFREPGAMASGLIADNYAMKGFRIDTKSCNWGPMAGFVCADPRLTKSAEYEDRNEKWTEEALSGHIVAKFFGNVEDDTWVADTMPIVISDDRIRELTRRGVISPRPEGRDLVGESSSPSGGVRLPWRMIPVAGSSARWLKVNGTGVSSGYRVLCVNHQATSGFQMRYPTGVVPVYFNGQETVLGLCNPNTKHLGFKACVTADYDLFAIWPPKDGGEDLVARRHNLHAQLLHKTGGDTSTIGGDVARMPKVDDRLQSKGHREHHRYGDVSGRVMLTKTLLNSALIGQDSSPYEGGNAIHHNDEAGNFALAKGSLQSCLPLIAFSPDHGTILVRSLADFKELVEDSRTRGYAVKAKPEWLKEAGL